MATPRGRRPGSPDTAEDILRAARDCFAERGYDAVSIRAIARRASVDPSLVLHYYGSKQRLFVAAVEPPYDVGAEIAGRLAGDRATAGDGLVRLFLSTWDDERRRPALVALLRAASTDPTAADLLRSRFTAMVAPLLAGLPQAAMRASLCAGQMLGLGLVRYVLRLEPLASAGHDAVA